MFKNFKLFEKYKDPKYKIEDYTLSEITENNYIEKGDRVYHVNSGPGTITELDNGVINIKFDMDNSNTHGKYHVDTVVKNGLLKLIDEEPIDDIFPESEHKNVEGRGNIEPPKKKIETIETKVETDDDDEDEEIEEEEDEDDDDDDDFFMDDITADELMTMNLTEFFNEGEMEMLVSLDDILNFRNSVDNVNDEDLNPFKKALKSKKLNMTYVMELYYNHLMDRIPGKDVYRFNGQIPHNELWDIRQKDRIDIPENIKDDAVFNSGVLFFWIFKDAIVFKTI